METSIKRRKFLARLVTGASAVVGTLAAGRFMGGAIADETVACIRPPGALDEKEFLAACIRCGRCADACPNRCINPFTVETGKIHAMRPGWGQRNTPVIFPRQQACILCNGVSGDTLLCTEACPTGALQLTLKNEDSVRENVHMGLAVVDEQICHSFNGASCGICVRACPLEGTALTAGMWEKPIVDPDACVGCGLCERACVRYPQAIRVRPKEAGPA